MADTISQDQFDKMINELRTISKEIKKLDKEVLKMIDDFFVIESDGSVYIPETGLNGIDVSFFVNNSKNSNLKIVGNGKDEALVFKATRPIKKGEELTVSYSTYDDKYK
jgi:SET domain-containing protein